MVEITDLVVATTINKNPLCIHRRDFVCLRLYGLPKLHIQRKNSQD